MIAKISDYKSEMCRPKAFYTDKTALASAVASGAITEAAAASITPTLDQIKMCVSIDNKDGCNNNQECQWGVVKGEDVPTTDPATPVNPTMPAFACMPNDSSKMGDDAARK